MKAINSINVIIIVLLMGMGTGFAQSSKQEVLEVLSRKEAEFEFKDVTITEALDKIGQFARVEIVLSDEAQWKLPHGEATRLSASLKGSLADCLTEMLSAFFMRYAVSDDTITIYPRKELEHILGKPSDEQLKLLKKIYAMRMSFSGEFSAENVIDLISRAFEGISFLPHDVPNRISEMCQTMSTEKGMAPVYFVALLEQVCDRFKWSTWYLSGMNFPNQVPMIKLVDEKEYREAVLNQVIDISIKDEYEDVILQRLAGWTGMELYINKDEPSWLKGEVDIEMQNIKLGQALRDIVSSMNGVVKIDIARGYIGITGPIHLQKVAAPRETKSSSGSGEGYVGKISIPIGEGEDKYFIEFMLREKDLTEELRKLREDKIKQILKKYSKVENDNLELTFHPQSYTILN